MASSDPRSTPVAASADDTTANAAPAPRSRFHWRVVDIVVTAVLAVAVGLIFWAWAAAWSTFELWFQAFPPLTGLIGGMWVLAGPLAGIIIRKPGAALFCEILAAAVEAVLGSHFGATVLLSGLVQGLGAEIVFALFGYKKFGFGVALFSGAMAGAFLGVSENILYNAAWTTGYQLVYLVCAIIGGTVIAGGLSWIALKALRPTGVLNGFAAGRTVEEV